MNAATGSATRAVLLGALEQALRAPSVHNTQPWRWRIDGDSVELHADRTRHLASTDPDWRDLVLSCGAALHHLRVGLAAAGVSTAVDRLPDPEQRELLAVLSPVAGAPDEREVALAAAIDARRTDRRMMTAPASPTELRALAGYASRHGAHLYPVVGPVARARLIAVLGEAGNRQRFAEGYPAELAIWTQRHAGGRDGIPPDLRTYLDTANGLRTFPPGRLPTPPRPRDGAEDLDTLAVLTTPTDEVADRLRAGEATSAVLLGATRMGLASTPLSQAVEIDHTRRQLAHVVPHAQGFPQLVIRLGRPMHDGIELQRTPRRPLRWVLLPPGHGAP